MSFSISSTCGSIPSSDHPPTFASDINFLLASQINNERNNESKTVKRISNLIFVPTVSLKDIQFVPSTKAVQQIYIIRHGESVLNIPDEQGIMRVQGQSNHAPLTEKGIKQAQQLGELIAERIPSNANIVICASTAVRAKTTAECIYEVVNKKFSNCELADAHSGLCELSKGEYEGSPKKLEEEDVAKWNKLSAKEKYRTPIVRTGESYSNIVDRSLKGLQTLSDKYQGKTLIVVSHGRIFQGLYLKWTGKIPVLSSKTEPLIDFMPKNCDILMGHVTEGNKVSEAFPCAHIQFPSEEELTCNNFSTKT